MQFLVLEGLDGSGTTTQVAQLAIAMRARGMTVVETREPTGGAIGQVIRSVLAGRPDTPPEETLPWLFAADRADHLFRTVEPALQRGECVVSDRYYHSSLAYQSLTMPLGEVHALNAHFRAPDLTLYLQVPVEVCLERIAARQARDGSHAEIYERRDRMERIAEAYDEVIAYLRQRGERIVAVDGQGEVDQVAERIRTEADRHLDEHC